MHAVFETPGSRPTPLPSHHPSICNVIVTSPFLPRSHSPRNYVVTYNSIVHRLSGLRYAPDHNTQRKPSTSQPLVITDPTTLDIITKSHPRPHDRKKKYRITNYTIQSASIRMYLNFLSPNLACYILYCMDQNGGATSKTPKTKTKKDKWS